MWRKNKNTAEANAFKKKNIGSRSKNWFIHKTIISRAIANDSLTRQSFTNDSWYWTDRRFSNLTNFFMLNINRSRMIWSFWINRSRTIFDTNWFGGFIKIWQIGHEVKKWIVRRRFVFKMKSFANDLNKFRKSFANDFRNNVIQWFDVNTSNFTNWS